MGSDAVKLAPGSPVYHECQQSMQCARHAVNNFLQAPVFSKSDFDRLTATIERDSGARSGLGLNTFGLGNYDLNVIEVALASKGYTLEWFDSRESVEKDLVLSKSCESTQQQKHKAPCIGLLVNISEGSKLIKFWPFRRRHFLSIVNVQSRNGAATLDFHASQTGEWWNLDSKLQAPFLYDNEDSLRRHLQQYINSSSDVHILRVLPSSDTMLRIHNL